MIYKNKKELNANFPNKVITAVYKGAVLVWEAINSCFGKGFWQGNKPWKGSDGWRG